MKRNLLSIALVCLTAIAAHADITYGGINFTGPDDDLAAASFAADAPAHVTIPKTFSVDGTDYTVGSITITRPTSQTITRVTVAEGFTEIPGYFMDGCPALEEINLPESITVIPRYAFSECRMLKKVTLGSKVTKIEANAFRGCKALAHVDLPASLTVIGSGAFHFCGLTDITIPTGVTKISSQSFRGNPIASLTLPDGLTGIQIGAFSRVTAKATITRLVIPKTVSSIGQSASAGLASVKEIVIEGGDDTGESMSIMSRAFDDIQPDYVACYRTTPPTLSATAFDDAAYEDSRLIVPAGSEQMYREAAGWQNFHTIETTAGIEDVAVDTSARYVVYDMRGIKRLDTTDATLIDTLPAGLYLINGRKHILQ